MQSSYPLRIFLIWIYLFVGTCTCISTTIHTPIAVYEGLSSLSYVTSSPHPSWFNSIIVLDAGHYRIVIIDPITGVADRIMYLPVATYNGPEPWPFDDHQKYISIDICTSNGNIYIGDIETNQVHIYDINGDIQQQINITNINRLTVAQDGSFFVLTGDTVITHFSATGAMLRVMNTSLPYGQHQYIFALAVSPDASATAGSLFYAATNQDTKQTVIIQMMIMTGQIQQQYQTTDPTIGEFTTISVGEDEFEGSLYVYDALNARVVEFALNGTKILQFDTLHTARRPGNHYSSTSDANVAIWLTGLSDTEPIIKYDQHGQVQPWQYQYPAWKQPQGITVQQNSTQVFVADSANSRLVLLNDVGGIARSIDTCPDSNCYCDHPIGVAVDAAGVIYVTCLQPDESSSATLYRIDSITNKQTPIFLKHNQINVSATDVIVDQQGYVYVRDLFTDTANINHNVFKVDPITHNIIQTFNVSTSSHDTGSVYGMAVDVDGDVYMLYQLASPPTVYRFSSSGIQRAVTYSSPSIQGACCIAVSISGDVYVAGSSGDDKGVSFVMSFNSQGQQQNMYSVDINNQEQYHNGFSPMGIAIDDVTGTLYAVDRDDGEQVLKWKIQQQQQRQVQQQ